MKSIFIATLTAIDFVQLNFYVLDMFTLEILVATCFRFTNLHQWQLSRILFVSFHLTSAFRFFFTDSHSRHNIYKTSICYSSCFGVHWSKRTRDSHIRNIKHKIEDLIWHYYGILWNIKCAIILFTCGPLSFSCNFVFWNRTLTAHAKVCKII